jgi:hypothetical protein
MGVGCNRRRVGYAAAVRATTALWLLLGLLLGAFLAWGLVSFFAS